MKIPLYIWQIIKHVLVGAFATLFDLLSFMLLAFIFPGVYNLSSVIIKGCSFLVAAIIKYLGNKYWTFKKIEEGISHIEFGKFLMTNLIGLIFDIFTFYIITKIIGPHFGLSYAIWEKIGVLCAAVVAGVWNFIGDKFIVFKK